MLFLFKTQAFKYVQVYREKLKSILSYSIYCICLVRQKDIFFLLVFKIFYIIDNKHIYVKRNDI